MKEFVFFDTGFWIALMDKNDQRYEIVQTTFSNLSQYQWYVSDFVIFETDKNKLAEYQSEINDFLKTLKLELHPDKSKIISLSKRINFTSCPLVFV